MRLPKTLLVVAIAICVMAGSIEASYNTKRSKNRKSPEPKLLEQKAGSAAGKTNSVSYVTAISAAGLKLVPSHETAKLVGSLVVCTLTLFAVDHLASIFALASEIAQLCDKGLSTLRAALCGLPSAALENAAFKVCVEHPMAQSVIEFACSPSTIYFAMIALFSTAFYFGCAKVVLLLRRASFGAVFGLLVFSLLIKSELRTPRPMLAAASLVFAAIAFAKPSLSLHLAALLFDIIVIGYYHFYENGSLHFDYDRTLSKTTPFTLVREVLNNATSGSPSPAKPNGQ